MPADRPSHAVTSRTATALRVPFRWSAAQIVAGGPGHLIPTEFTGSLYDETLGQTLFTFDQVKGGGNANRNQSAVTCTHSKSGRCRFSCRGMAGERHPGRPAACPGRAAPLDPPPAGLRSVLQWRFMVVS
jgi:hypothetical protein